MMSVHEHFAFKQSKFIALKPYDRDLYFNYKLRKWFDNNNVSYSLDANGNSTGKLIDHQIRYVDFCEELAPILQKTSYIKANPQFSANTRLTENVKILLKAHDVSKIFGTYLNGIAEKIFYKMVKESKEKKTQQSEQKPVEKPVETPLQVEEKPLQVKEIPIKIVVPEFDEDEWD